MTTEKQYDEFCKKNGCTNYIERELEGDICCSCLLVGQSYNVDKYPDNCIFIDEIKYWSGETK
jgi:hypothetical protein